MISATWLKVVVGGAAAVGVGICIVAEPCGAFLGGLQKRGQVTLFASRSRAILYPITFTPTTSTHRV